MPRPKRTQHPPRPVSATPVARGTCQGCGQFRVMSGDVLADHLTFVHQDGHPAGGVHETCPGAGQPPSGRVVHGARLDRS